MSRGWYNRSIHKLTLVDHIGVARPAIGFFAPPVCHSFCRPRKVRRAPSLRITGKTAPIPVEACPVAGMVGPHTKFSSFVLPRRIS